MSPFIKNIPQEKILVAVSGGVDSVVLFDLLKQQDIIVAHVNHNLRGKESDKDEQFVKELVEKNNISFYSKKLTDQPKNEEEARDERYAFFEEVLEKTGAKYIALAHHKDDQIETCFMQLIRGTKSFSPMKEFSAKKWRPLLQHSKQDLVNYAQENNLEWREDSTNQESEFSRNKIRNILLPEIQDINSSFSELFLQFIDAVQQDATYIQSQAEVFVKGKENQVHRSVFLDLDTVLKKAVIKILKPSLYAKHVQEVLEMIEKGEGKKEKHGVFLDKGIIYFEGKVQEELSQRIILASQSPRRKRLMESMGYNFEVIPSAYDEVWDKSKTIEENVQIFGEEKARDVFKNNRDAVVIGCDTFIVHPQGGVYLKPKDRDDAKRMFRSYSGSTVDVLSGVSVMSQKGTQTQLVKTVIEFADFDETVVEEWLDRNEWQGRSGSCSIEGFASRYVKRIDGCFFNIVGLPTQVVDTMLQNA